MGARGRGGRPRTYRRKPGPRKKPGPAKSAYPFCDVVLRRDNKMFRRKLAAPYVARPGQCGGCTVSHRLCIKHYRQWCRTKKVGTAKDGWDPGAAARTKALKKKKDAEKEKKKKRKQDEQAAAAAAAAAGGGGGAGSKKRAKKSVDKFAGKNTKGGANFFGSSS